MAVAIAAEEEATETTVAIEAAIVETVASAKAVSKSAAEVLAVTNPLLKEKAAGATKGQKLKELAADAEEKDNSVLKY